MCCFVGYFFVEVFLVEVLCLFEEWLSGDEVVVCLLFFECCLVECFGVVGFGVLSCCEVVVGEFVDVCFFVVDGEECCCDVVVCCRELFRVVFDCVCFCCYCVDEWLLFFEEFSCFFEFVEFVVLEECLCGVLECLCVCFCLCYVVFEVGFFVGFVRCRWRVVLCGVEECCCDSDVVVDGVEDVEGVFEVFFGGVEECLCLC